MKDEWAAEGANQTMHGVLLALLVKPNGMLGKAYTAAIKSFRHLIVYPMMMRDVEAAWRTEKSPSDR